MTDYIYRVAIIVPDNAVEDARGLAEVMGWGSGCYRVALSDDGEPPASWWGLSTIASQSFVDLIEAAQIGHVPPDLDAELMGRVMGAVRMSIGPADTSPVAQFDALCAEHGLTRIVPA